MGGFFQGLFQFISNVWNGIGAAMSLNPRVFEIVEQYPQSRWVILTIALLGGASLLLGQSVILFVNRVKPGRFAMSLLMNGIVFTIGLVVWGLGIWLVGKIFFDDPPTLGVVTRLVGLSAAPYVFGFLVLAPYLGNFFGRAISVWSFLVMLAAINYVDPGGFFEALVVVGLGWVLMLLLTNVVGKPVIALRNNLWHRITGSNMDTSVQDILLTFSQEQTTLSVSPDKNPNHEQGKP
jgi:hypothetical protein